ncbi:hypothetical protein TGS27_2286 [Geobacillus stearothermophilus]|uniref:Uncharacterized protein n=1 Tax=Geobacillus stearothermophilus TaxID=1422 RepID=A0A150NA10_GEOSE|nr:hypothetical protein B4114_1114 [Geobacillus stearothermophilus]OAO78943.1 hypothetical protein TGS27_2286 [Geobacillus stearothermophilus]
MHFCHHAASPSCRQLPCMLNERFDKLAKMAKPLIVRLAAAVAVINLLANDR